MVNGQSKPAEQRHLTLEIKFIQKDKKEGRVTLLSSSNQKSKPQYRSSFQYKEYKDKNFPVHFPKWLMKSKGYTCLALAEKFLQGVGSDWDALS